MSQSRQGSARSAAILLYSHQLNALKNNSTESTSFKSRSDEYMAKYIEQQLEDQKRLLYLEVPALRDHSTLMHKLRLNLRSESDLSQFDSFEKAEKFIFDSPLRSKLKQKLFKSEVDTEVSKFIGNSTDLVEDERTGVDESNLRSNLISNPMAYSLNDLDDDHENEKDRKYVIDNEEIFIGALPSPACEIPSIAVKLLLYALVCKNR